MKGFAKVFRIKRGFTLLECILAMAILAATAAVLLPMLSSAYGFILSSQSLDNLTSIAERNALTYPYNPSYDVATDADTGYTQAYAGNFTANIYFGVDPLQQAAVGVEPFLSKYNMVATIVTDTRGNVVVYYAIDPNDLVTIYARDYD